MSPAWLFQAPKVEYLSNHLYENDSLSDNDGASDKEVRWGKMHVHGQCGLYLATSVEQDRQLNDLDTHNLHTIQADPQWQNKSVWHVNIEYVAERAG